MDATDLKEKVIELVEDYLNETGILFDDDIILESTSKKLSVLDKKLIKDIEQLDDEPESDLILIRCDNMLLRDKLEQFLQSEIYPHFKEYESKVEGL